MLGEMYKRGYSVLQDENASITWLERAASLGSSSAKYHLALKMTVQLPISVNTNPANFEEFSTLSESEQFRQVISCLDLKSTMHAFDIAMEEKEDELDDVPNEDHRYQVIRRVVQLLLSAASDGHVESNTELGQMFEVIGDYEEAAQWYSEITTL